MSELSLRFEPTDLAGWLWIAVAVLILLELARYVWSGRRPSSRPRRVGLTAAILVALAAISQSERFRFDASTHAYACIILAILIAAWILRGYARTTRSIPPQGRLLLLTLRLAAAGMVLLIAAGPVLQRTDTVYERPVLGLAIDDSRSMSIVDAADADLKSPLLSRSDAVKSALDRTRPVLHELDGTLDLRWFNFDTRVVACGAGVGPLTAGGHGTAIGDAVQQVRAALSQTLRPLAGIVVISDGRDNSSTETTPEASATDAAAAGIPLYAVGVGSEVPVSRTRNLLARRLDAPERIAARNRLPVRAEFYAVGLAGHPIEFELLLDGNFVERRSIEPQQVTDLLRIDMSCTPAEAGLHRVIVRARTPQIDHPVEISRFVQASDDKIPVLYIDRPRYERAAISRALDAAEEFRVIRTDLNPNATGQSSPLPRTAEEWRRVSVILIGDVAAEAFPTQTMEAMAEAVRNGVGLAMLGGLRSLGSDSFAQTPLGNLLPVEMTALGQMTERQKIELTPSGRSHPVCRLEVEPKANENLWKLMPAIEGSSQLGKPLPASEILLQTPAGQPLLVVREAGAGRTAVVGFDSTWQWAFADDRGTEMQKRFWRQLALWLANRNPGIWVTVDRQEYDWADLQAGRRRIQVRAGFTDVSGGTKDAGVSLYADIEGSDGKHVPINLTAHEKEFVGEARPWAAGDFRIKVVARAEDRILGQSQTAFVVSVVDREMADPLPDLQLLRRMAAETQHLGGTYASLTDLATLLRDISAATRPTEIRQVRRWNLVHDHPWPWYTVFLTILALEWVFRRRKGLV